MAPPKLNLTALEEFKALLREQSRRGVRPESKSPSTAVELESKRWEAKTPEERKLAEDVLGDYLTETGNRPIHQAASEDAIESAALNEGLLGYPKKFKTAEIDTSNYTKRNENAGLIRSVRGGTEPVPGKSLDGFASIVGPTGKFERLEKTPVYYTPAEPAVPGQRDGGHYGWMMSSRSPAAAEMEANFWRAVEDPDVLPMKTPAAPSGRSGDESKLSDFKRALLWAARKADSVLPDTAENPEWLDTLVTGSPMASSIGLESNEAKRARRAAGRGQLEDAVDAATTPEGLALWRLLSKVR